MRTDFFRTRLAALAAVFLLLGATIACNDSDDPDNGEAAYSLGLLLVETGQIDEALVWLERAARALPRNARVHYNLGLLLQQQGRIEQAVLYLNAMDKRSATRVLNEFKTEQEQRLSPPMAAATSPSSPVGAPARPGASGALSLALDNPLSL